MQNMGRFLFLAFLLGCLTNIVLADTPGPATQKRLRLLRRSSEISPKFAGIMDRGGIFGRVTDRMTTALDQTYHVSDEAVVREGAKPPTKDKGVSVQMFVYKYEPRSMIWSRAQEECERWNGNLVTITSQTENYYLKGQLESRYIDFAWIGYNDISKEGTFQWVGRHGAYTNWREGEPNQWRNHNEDCVTMVIRHHHNTPWYGTWNDRPCELAAPSICQKATRTQHGQIPQVPARNPPKESAYLAENEDGEFGEYAPKNAEEDHEDEDTDLDTALYDIGT